MVAMNTCEFEVGHLVKISGEAGMHRIVGKEYRTLKVRKEFEGGRQGSLKEVDALEVSYSAGPVQSHDDGKVIQPLSKAGMRLEKRIADDRRSRINRGKFNDLL